MPQRGLTPVEEELLKRQSLSPETTDLLQRAWKYLYPEEHVDPDKPNWRTEFMPETPPDVPTPYPFAPEPAVNDAPTQRLLHKVLEAAPGIRPFVNKVHVGPTPVTMLEMERSKLPIDAFQGTNLMGVTDANWPHNIALNPAMGDDDMLNTLTHELSHARGFGEGVATRIGDDVEAAEARARDQARRKKVRK